ncbi:OmpA family protein [Eikenella sp. S3360]|uniref:OmpA family protein n=1 Tax=Eikenella glucosivorans TaxID=2766967 RepID=A0ABS0N9D1_9NEIS|nr:OmpA family protein [Eikenella glucosivorans]MBH5328880.1 OmpA family protein [Eikenella glucosivorans]
MMKRLTVLTLAASFALSGCVTDPVTGQQTISKTALYGLGGAAACGAIGALTHGSKGARNAALGCGVVGAGVGGYMDIQERRLRQELANTPVEVERQGDQIKLTMPSGVTFATNSSALSPNAVSSLNTVADVLTQYPETTITVAGHTDNTGNDRINNPLSQQRAQSVAGYLNGRGVAANRISTVGYGSRSPIADNSTEVGRAQNRRVEILINPTSQARRQ